jgi:hypothetical protein
MLYPIHRLALNQHLALVIVFAMSITVDHSTRHNIQEGLGQDDIKPTVHMCLFRRGTGCCKFFFLVQSLSYNWQTVTCLRTLPYSIDMRTVFINICRLECPWLGDGKDINCSESKLNMSYNLYCQTEPWLKNTVEPRFTNLIGSWRPFVNRNVRKPKLFFP